MFGRESRVIITTRDYRVLRNREFAEFTKIHEMKAMENEHALELFSWHAFGQRTPPEEYSLLSDDAVSLTGRLPLSLEITGSLFFVGGRKNWKQTVVKLKKKPNVDVLERLKISYEDLEEETKDIFLDIACFFVNKQRSDEDAMWNACDFFSELAIEELISMCLVKIEEEDGKYWMHDQIKDLGREIVRKEGPKEKEQRSRIWNKQDSIGILTAASRRNLNNKIEGILLEHLTNGVDEILTLRGENCVNLDRLRFLHLEGPGGISQTSGEVQVEGSFEHLLPNLRWLSLQWVKMKRFNATNFSLKKLVVLNFSGSDIAESWAGWNEFKDLPSLEVLNLSCCQGLKKTPDLSHCTSLKKLLLSHCENLEEIDRSIIYLKTLEYLDLKGCSSLKELPADEQLEDSTRLQSFKLQISNSIGAGLVNLEYLSLSYCFHLQSLPNSITSLPKLRHLDLSWCRKLKKLPDSIGELVELEVLLLEHCSSLVSLPNSLTSLPKLHILNVSSCDSLESLSYSVVEMVQLTQLDLSYCKGLKMLPDSIGELVELEALSLSGCSDLVSLPNSITSLSKLHILNVSFCSSLESLPDSVGEMVLQLTQLDISYSALKKLPGFISQQKKLEVLRANGIKMQGFVPTEIEELHCLREMSFDGSSICGLPSLVKLTRLEKLSLSDCHYLQHLPAQLPTSLVQLHVSYCPLQTIPDYSYLTNLTDLKLYLRKSGGDLREQQELNLSWIWRLSKVKELHIWTYFTTIIESEESSSVSLLSQLKELTLCCSILGTCVIMPSFLSALRKLKISLFRGTTSLSLPRLNRLTHFILTYSDDLEQILGLGELESLISLEIRECKSLKRLDDISKLRQLLTLKIYWCDKLRVIPVVPSLRSLEELVIRECESLESLVGPSESESCLDDIHRVKSLRIIDCPLLENKLPDNCESSMDWHWVD